MKTSEQKEYWTKRYREQNTGWDIGYVSPPLKAYIDQIENKKINILIPGAGNAYEAQYLYEQGFKNTYVLDISLHPLENFAERNPDFPKSQLIAADFFEYSDTQFDLILEQTFFCSFSPTPENRKKYAERMAQLLRPGGKLVGVWFDFPLTRQAENRPFGGSQEEYLSYLTPHFEVITMERCYNSIPPRQERELFGIFMKK